MLHAVHAVPRNEFLTISGEAEIMNRSIEAALHNRCENAQ